jgi:phage tail-like protein
MSTGTRRDPLPVYCFKVTIDSIGGETFFKSVSGLKSETEVTDFKAGGVNNTTFRLVGATKWPNLVLKRGFSQGFDELIKWRDEWLDEGKSLTRRSGTIYQLRTDLSVACSWEFQNGWPCKWELSEFDASKNELAIETLEIAHEGLKFIPSPK